VGICGMCQYDPRYACTLSERISVLSAKAEYGSTFVSATRTFNATVDSTVEMAVLVTERCLAGYTTRIHRSHNQVQIQHQRQRLC